MDPLHPHHDGATPPDAPPGAVGRPLTWDTLPPVDRKVLLALTTGPQAGDGDLASVCARAGTASGETAEALWRLIWQGLATLETAAWRDEASGATHTTTRYVISPSGRAEAAKAYRSADGRPAEMSL